MCKLKQCERFCGGKMCKIQWSISSGVAVSWNDASAMWANLFLPIVFVAVLFISGPSPVLAQRSTPRLWVCAEGRFPSSVCPSHWCVAVRCRRSKFSLGYVFTAVFFPAAFILCDIWDVLEQLQPWEYKFCFGHDRLTNLKHQNQTELHLHWESK